MVVSAIDAAIRASVAVDGQADPRAETRLARGGLRDSRKPVVRISRGMMAGMDMTDVLLAPPASGKTVRLMDAVDEAMHAGAERAFVLTPTLVEVDLLHDHAIRRGAQHRDRRSVRWHGGLVEFGTFGKLRGLGADILVFVDNIDETSEGIWHPGLRGLDVRLVTARPHDDSMVQPVTRCDEFSTARLR